MSQCLPISASHEIKLQLISPAPGVLHIRIQEQGVSVVATLDGDPQSEASSPVERFGVIALLADTRRGSSHTVRIRTEDSPDIAGTSCYRAFVHPDSNSAHVVAANALAAAGRAIHKRDWETAFDQYANAARRFDSLNLWRSAALTRQPMAELAYRRLYRKRESYALAAQALADLRRAQSPATAERDADQIYFGLLTELQGKALIDAPGGDVHANAPTIRKLLSAARRYDTESGVGNRELPRLDIMTGFLEYMLDQPVRTHELFSHAAEHCRELRDWDCYAIANQNLALLAAESNNYAAALSAYANALQMLPPGLDPKLAADIWNNYGRVQGIVGLFSNSERSHARAMHEYARLGDCLGVRRSLSLSGNLMVQIGTLSDAEDSLESAASHECPELLNGNYSSSAQTRAADRGQLCSRPLDPSTLAIDNKMTVFNALLSLGGALMLEGEPKLAQHCYDAAENYAATARTQMRLLNARGAVFLEGNDAAGAKTAFERSLRVADEADIPSTYEYRGAAQLGILKATLLAGQYSAAVTSGFQALKSSVGRADIDQTVTSLRLLATGLRGLQQFAEAADTLQAAANLTQAVPIDELDGEKRATYLATQYTVFEDLTDLYASQAGADQTNLAFATSEEGRARSLRYAVNQATRGAASQLEAPPATRYQELLREVANLTGAQSNSSAATLVNHLNAAALRLRGDEPTFDRAQLTRTVQQLDATLIEYAVGDRDMFAFVVNDDTTQVVRLGDKGDIAAAAADLHDRLRDTESPVKDIGAAAGRLAKLIFWPLVDAVGDRLARKRIVIVPDGALHTVPFNVLPWSSNLSDKLVVNHAEVSIVPSALFLTRLRALNRTRSNAPRIELIGDPVFRISDWNHECADIQEAKPVITRAVRAFADWTESLPRLPGSRMEVQMIAQLAKQSRTGSRVDTYLGCAAAPAALRAAASNHVDLLHIATHARVDAQRPRLSALALSPESGSRLGNSAFGLLDILGLKLNASLVVLSACDTSRGRLLPGEGVLGPAQAFLQSGAASVLASYWRVDDQTTSHFMERFYRYLLVDHQPAAAALRRAQLDAAANSPAYDWAAFALYGWPDTGI